MISVSVYPANGGGPNLALNSDPAVAGSFVSFFLSIGFFSISHLATAVPVSLGR